MFVTMSTQGNLTLQTKVLGRSSKYCRDEYDLSYVGGNRPGGMGGGGAKISFVFLFVCVHSLKNASFT